MVVIDRQYSGILFDFSGASDVGRHKLPGNQIGDGPLDRKI